MITCLLHTVLSFSLLRLMGMMTIPYVSSEQAGLALRYIVKVEKSYTSSTCILHV